jgi:diacylglycerol kinase (ATP)
MLPLGTGNSFLRDFRIADADGAIAALKRDQAKRIDVVRCEHRGGTLRYFNLLSIGFTAAVGALTNARFKPFGQAGYAMAVVTSLTRLAPHRFPLRLDDAEIDFRPCTLLSFSNSRFTAGTMEMAPPADPSDGLVDVIRVGPMSRLELIRTFPSIYKGEHLRSPKIEAARAARIELPDARQTDVMVDGEVLQLAVRALVVEPGALEVVV